ncbi:hypothetical protein Tco_0515462 [Tanacetum coccineum]
MVVVGMTAAAGGYEVEGGDVVCDVADLVVTMWRQRWWCSVVALAGEGCDGVEVVSVGGPEVGWIRRIHVLDTVYWRFLGVGTTFDIFQNIILIPYLEYGVLSPLDTAYWSSE